MILLDELAGRDSCFLIIDRALSHREIKQETETGEKEGQTKGSIPENPNHMFPTLGQSTIMCGDPSWRDCKTRKQGRCPEAPTNMSKLFTLWQEGTCKFVPENWVIKLQRSHWARDVTQLTKWWLSIQKTLDSISSVTWMVREVAICAHNASTWKVEEKNQRFRVILRYTVILRASLCFMRPCLNKKSNSLLRKFMTLCWATFIDV